MPLIMAAILMRKMSRFAVFLVIFTARPMLLSAQEPQPVPVIDGGAGPCSCELKVMTSDGKPAAAADVKVHIEYGFGGFRRLDLEAGANQDGKVRFTGLPAKVKRPPLEFRASKNQLNGVATFDPLTECQAKHDITLEKPASSASF